MLMSGVAGRCGHPRNRFFRAVRITVYNNQNRHRCRLNCTVRDGSIPLPADQKLEKEKMNQKISNAPVIGMIVAIMLLTLSVGVNIWLYNESQSQSQYSDWTSSIQRDYNVWGVVAKDTVWPNRFADCYAIAQAIRLQDIQRGYKHTNQAKLHHEINECQFEAEENDFDMFDEWYKLEWRGPFFP